MDEGRFASCDGRALVLKWRINRHFFFTFEIDMEQAEAVVPPELQVVQLRPGVALLSVGILRYEAGHFSTESTPFNEIVGAIHVAPDLSADMPVPSMTFASFRVLADSHGFAESEHVTLFTPCLVAPLKLAFTDDQLGVEAVDDDGPIISVPSGHPEPRWTHGELWGQHFTNTKGLQHGIWEWDGSMYEHQRPVPGWKLWQHPFWGDIDVSRIRRLYRTMLHEPGTLCYERFYEMRPMAT